MSVSTPGHGMIHCPECGWEIDPDDEMCPNCGAYLADYEDLEPKNESPASGVEEVAGRPFEELPESAGRRGDVPADDLARRAVDQDRVRSPAILVRREPDRGVQELGVLHIDLGRSVLDEVHEVPQQLALMRVDVLPREAFRFVLVDLRVQESGIAHHAARREGHLEGERDLVVPRREIAGAAAEDLPEVVPSDVPVASLVRAGPREDARVSGRRVDLEHVERQVDALEGRDARGLPQVVGLHHTAAQAALDRPHRAVAIEQRREHRVPQDERLVALDAGCGAAVRARHDDLARGEVQRAAALRATDRLDEFRHACVILMRRAILALRVGTLNALRRGSVLTVFFVFAFLSLLLLIILAAADYALQAQAFPGAFAIVVGLALFFIFLQWLISPWIVRWAIRQRQAITPQSNPWL